MKKETSIQEVKYFFQQPLLALIIKEKTQVMLYFWLKQTVKMWI